MVSDEQEDFLIFADEQEDSTDRSLEKECWKIIIVDDENEVHNVTRMVLSDFEFDGKRLELISAFTESEALNVLKDHPDVAIILLDVVMDQDDSGLRLVKYIREQLKYQSPRIILRTGQPGQAPEKTVIMNYDINDYKEKTELTSQKLFTTVMSALRSYRDIMVIENNKIGLEKIINSSADLFELKSMRKFASGVLTQLTSILNLNKNALHCNSFAVSKGQETIYILAATGDYSPNENDKIEDVVPARVLVSIENTFREKKGSFYDDHFTCYFESKTGSENVIYFEGSMQLNEWNRYLIEIYSSNVSVAFENIYLNEEVENTQKEIIFTLGEIAETRSKETGNHVKRVAEYSKLLALKFGIPEEEAEIVRLASSMHDVGKVAVPDAILNKPGKLTPEEFDTIKNHTNHGYAMLNHSNRDIIKTAAIIAHQHHEKYNGQGYPNGLAGEDIHIYGRIAALADVFDALGSERVYKKAWPLEDILDYFRQESGQHFDPQLVKIFFDNLQGILKIRDQYSDVMKS
ncbi:response regulator [Cohnella luojiensis]|uniref:Response regulator n=1 Tax=Cohnella luojiensis TaxID=652876 RepID=A0A4Y8LR72_9BACL|nr:response regulator [Cohnella luojiensis]TFE23321.1 response regulator [Cohnella luojiensis]